MGRIATGEITRELADFLIEKISARIPGERLRERFGYKVTSANRITFRFTPDFYYANFVNKGYSTVRMPGRRRMLYFLRSKDDPRRSAPYNKRPRQLSPKEYKHIRQMVKQKRAFFIKTRNGKNRKPQGEGYFIGTKQMSKWTEQYLKKALKKGLKEEIAERFRSSLGDIFKFKSGGEV